LSAFTRSVSARAPFPTKPGVYPLGFGAPRDGLVVVPPTRARSAPTQLLLALHGAGGDARGAVAPLERFARDCACILVAPESRGQTWDLMIDGFGSDVAFVDRAMQSDFESYAIDVGHIGIEGFSDGASYALSLGLANGDLFTHIIAFSPGFMAPPARRGGPRVFVTHGRQDPVLPIHACSRRIVPPLERAGYDVDYREFADGHVVPTRLARAAMDWFCEAA
jgi:predicted esterase